MKIHFFFLCMLVSFLLSILIGSILIPFLKKKKLEQSLSVYLKKEHSKKCGTPTFGGLIFLFSTLISYAFLSYLFHLEKNYNILIILFTFISYGVIGFLDDFLIIKRKNNVGLKEGEKLFLQLITSCIFFYLFLKGDNEPLLWIHIFHLKIDISFFYGLFILFILVATSNAVNLTDGLDGLACGLSILSYICFFIITLYTGWLEGYFEIATFISLLIGSLFGFLFFNFYPAKVFMGDTGSLALGATLGSIAILTRREFLLIFICFVFLIETLSCILQRYYYKLTKKRLFKMAPIHHTLEKMGMEEVDIVKLFWTIGLFFSFLSILLGGIR